MKMENFVYRHFIWNRFYGKQGEIRVYIFLEKWVYGRQYCQTILTFNATEKLMNFT